MTAGISPAMRVAEARRDRQSALERALTCAFWRTVQNEPMPVMAALEAAARALGHLYRQTAAAHGPAGTCGCDWQPDPEADLIVLEAMLAAAVMQQPVEGLAEMEVAGRA